MTQLSFPSLLSNLTKNAELDNHSLKIKFTLAYKFSEPVSLEETSPNLHFERKCRTGFEPFGIPAMDDFEFMLKDKNTADVSLKVIWNNETTVLLCHKFLLIG